MHVNKLANLIPAIRLLIGVFGRALSAFWWEHQNNQTRDDMVS